MNGWDLCCYRTECLIYLLAPVLKYMVWSASQLAGSILFQFLLLALPAFPLQCWSRWITACKWLLWLPPFTFHPSHKAFMKCTNLSTEELQSCCVMAAEMAVPMCTGPRKELAPPCRGLVQSHGSWAWEPHWCWAGPAACRTELQEGQVPAPCSPHPAGPV